MPDITLPKVNKRTEFVAMHGGLDVVSPPMSIPPGFVRSVQNFEEDITGGYVTTSGYERFDGRKSPSSASYEVLPYTVRGTVAIGDTITGADSDAVGTVIAITYNEFIITLTDGTFQAENTVTGGATVTGPAIPFAKVGKTAAIYLNLAADKYRALIEPVPGAGPILGVYYFKGSVFAFRNKEGEEAGVGMYQSTESGWQEVAFGIEIAFTDGSGVINEGDTISQGGVSAVVVRIVVEGGEFDDGDAYGRFIVGEVTGGSFAAGAFTNISGNVVSQAAISIPNQDGRFQFITTNFGGQLESLKMYGCDGVNRGFEFDGEVFIPINTKTPTDTPVHVVEHQKHLFFSFGASAIHSGIGDPYRWDTIDGAGEIAVSDTITGFLVLTGSESSPAMAIYSRNKTVILYGSDAETWQKISYDQGFGAIPYSQQNILSAYVLDDTGITTLGTSTKFGNFEDSSVSTRIKTLLETKRSQLKDSHISRSRQQYRLFFSDGSALFCTVGQNFFSPMLIQYPIPVLCSVSEETYGGGDELIFFGSDTGFVYQLGKGTSFDGEEIEASFNTAYNASKMYRMLKKYKRTTFEMLGSGYSEFVASYELSYSSGDNAQPEAFYQNVDQAVSYWDNFIWDHFVWDGRPMMDMSLSTPGDGDNISITVYSKSDFFTPVKFTGMFIEFTLLRMKR